MKKSLVACAVLAMAAGSAAATNVQLYGFLDYGLQSLYGRNAFTGERLHKFQMVTGERNGNRWGMKGTEDLGNGFKVGFHLESGFNADDGTLKNNRLFSRQATVMVDTPYGSAKAGRTGGINAPNDSYLSTSVIASAWGGGTFNGSTSMFWFNAREDNTIEYKTPEFAGLSGILHYSFNIDGSEAEHSSGNQRDAAIGLRYRCHLLEFRGAYEKNLMKSADKVEDPETVTAGLRLNLKPVTVSMGAQYVRHVRSFGATGSFSADTAGTIAGYQKDYLARTGKSAGTLSDGFKGFGASLGAWYEVGAGRYIINATRLNYKVEDTGEKVGFWMASAGLHYAFSKRTSLWGIVGIGEGTGKADKYEMRQVTVGLRHTF